MCTRCALLSVKNAGPGLKSLWYRLLGMTVSLASHLFCLHCRKFKAVWQSVDGMKMHGEKNFQIFVFRIINRGCNEFIKTLSGRKFIHPLPCGPRKMNTTTKTYSEWGKMLRKYTVFHKKIQYLWAEIAYPEYTSKLWGAIHKNTLTSNITA